MHDEQARLHFNRRRFLRGTLALGIGVACGSCSATTAPPSVSPHRLTPVPATSQANMPTGMPALRGVGRLLYIGEHEGVSGILLATEVGGRSLLAPGLYEQLAWSPDGGRFAALAAPLLHSAEQELAIFANDGVAMLRVAIPWSSETVSELLWSPDARWLLCRQRDRLTGIVTGTLVGDGGLYSLPLEAGAEPWYWTPDGRLTYMTGASGAISVPGTMLRTVWTVGATGEGPRREAEGAIAPVAWSPDGGVLYALGASAEPGEPTMGDGTWSTMLLALNLRRGSQNILVDLTRASVLAARRWIEAIAIAPAGDRLAYWLREAPRGTPPAAGAQPSSTLVIIDAYGRELTRHPARSGGVPVWSAWSPDGRHLACQLTAVDPGVGEEVLQIVASDPAAALTYSVERPRIAGAYCAWSPDSGWVAYVAPGNLALANAGHTEVYPLASHGSAPAWHR